MAHHWTLSFILKYSTSLPTSRPKLWNLSKCGTNREFIRKNYSVHFFFDTQAYGRLQRTLYRTISRPRLRPCYNRCIHCFILKMPLLLRQRTAFYITSVMPALLLQLRYDNWPHIIPDVLKVFLSFTGIQHGLSSALSKDKLSNGWTKKLIATFVLSHLTRISLNPILILHHSCNEL